MPALLLGSISALADTSELQREAFNQAFAQHGLDWRWDRADYVAMLESSGGADRVTAYAAQQGQDVDARAIHQTKSALFQQALASGDVVARPGVVATIEAARSGGFKVGLVTTTSPENVAALTAALAGTVDVASFDVVVDSSRVQQAKPDAAAYTFALQQLGESAADCVAVEDNVGGVQSATAAGLSCVAFPNANTADHDFTEAAGRVDELDFAELRDLAHPVGA